MKLMIQFATRGRKERFMRCFQLYVSTLGGNNEVFFNINCDNDDQMMNNEETKAEILSIYPHCYVNFDDNKNKIEAINANIEVREFNILLNASDDMNPQIHGWDDRIRQDFEQFFPDYDGVVHYNDGLQGAALNTLSIMGKPFYERFGYVYHPDYKSLWADVEFTSESKRLNRVVYVNEMIIKHDHPSIADSINHNKIDKTFEDSEAPHDRDMQVFHIRQQQGFPKEKITND